MTAGMSGGGEEPGVTTFVSWLRAHARRALVRMYRTEERLFVFRLRRVNGTVVAEGLSRRYTAIALIGLAEDKSADPSEVLSGDSPESVLAGLMAGMEREKNLGDAALTLWAAQAWGYVDRAPARKRIGELRPDRDDHFTVEASWALASLCIDGDPGTEDIRDRIARRLIQSSHPDNGLFPHKIGERQKGLRSHVSCFADMVYPIQALSNHHLATGDRDSLDSAARCALKVCELQGESGQWWWHYDRRSGKIVEGYPVYAIHQDAMGPMALFALKEAGGPDFTAQIRKGMFWLVRSPELEGGSLVDHDADLVWRKVARREPGKLSRYVQAAASGIHPSARAPGLDILFPPVEIDFEDRPYHLGWVLHAWNPRRAAAWEASRVVT